MPPRVSRAVLALGLVMAPGCGGLHRVSAPAMLLFGVEDAAVVDGERVWFPAGAANRETRFEGAASILTGIAVAQLVERGLLDPEAPVEVYVPELAGKNPFPRALRLKHVMAHTSGLRDRKRALRRADETLEDGLSRVLGRHGRLRTEPGARQVEARVNMLVLGVAIERVSGRRYDQYVRENVLDPLEMTGTDLGGATANPWGDLRSTPGELGRLLAVLLEGGLWEGREVLGEEAVRQLFVADRDARGWARPLGSGWSRGVTAKTAYVEHVGADHVIRLYPKVEYGMVAVGPRRAVRTAAHHRYTPLTTEP